MGALSIDEKVAMPGDPDLDCFLTGLRVASVVATWTGSRQVEAIVTFEPAEAGGWWTDSVTGERVFPDSVTSTEVTFGLTMMPGFGHLLRRMLARLDAWAATRSLVAMTCAPGKWTLLRCPQHPAGEQVVLPRGQITGEDHPDVVT